MYRDRDLIAPAQSQSIIELIQSLFVLELIKPSRRVWLGSAWISDIPILDNEALSFSDLEPSWSADMISLSTLLLTIAQRGTEVIIIIRESKENRDFIQKIKNSKLYNSKIKIIIRRDFHEKGLLGEDYELFGTMNFTFNGISTNDEHIVYRSNPATIAERQMSMSSKYGI
jgi:hypothetical protein